MGLFARQRPVVSAPMEAETSATEPVRQRATRRAPRAPGTRSYDDHQLGYVNKRPPFGQWLKATWPDILTLLVLGAIALGVYFAKPAPTRLFSVFDVNGEIVYPEYSFPERNEIIPIWAAVLIAALVPIVVFLMCQVRVRSFWDVHNAVLGLLYALVTAAVAQVLIKWLIGGLRPHFLWVCAPYLGDTEEPPFWVDRSVCTGDQDAIDRALQSMPSGHATAAFAGLVFLSLYLNGKLKLFSNYHTALWKLVAVYAPILGACLIGGSLTIDGYHHWYDILVGAIIGTVMAFSAYRMVYASVFDFRFNHIPLARYKSFDYSTEAMGTRAFGSAVFTRKAGWGGVEAGIGGAPSDAFDGFVLRFPAGQSSSSSPHRFELPTNPLGNNPVTGTHTAFNNNVDHAPQRDSVVEPLPADNVRRSLE